MARKCKAAQEPEVAAKRQRTREAGDTDLNLMYSLIENYERYPMSLPVSARDMLADMSEVVFRADSCQDHTYIDELSGFLGSALKDADDKAREVISAAKDRVKEAEKELSVRTAARDSANESLQEATASVSAKEDELQIAQNKAAEVVNVSHEAELAHNARTEEKNILESEKASALAVYTCDFQKLLDGISCEDDDEEEPMISHVESLQKFLQALDVEESLLAVVPIALKNLPSRRTEFDVLTIREVERVLKANSESVGAKVKAALELEQEACAEAMGASALLDVLTSHENVCIQGLAEAQTLLVEQGDAHSKAEESVTQQNKSVCDCLCEAELLDARRQEIEEAIAAFDRLLARRRESPMQVCSSLPNATYDVVEGQKILLNEVADASRASPLRAGKDACGSISVSQSILHLLPSPGRSPRVA